MIQLSKKIVLILFCSLGATKLYAACDCGSTDSSSPCTGTSIDVPVSGSDKTVTFNWEFNSGGGDAYCGQFANGDYWIAPRQNGSLVLTGVDSAGAGGTTADINPVTHSHGLLSGGNNYGSHNPAENIVSGLPVNVLDSGYRVPTRDMPSEAVHASLPYAASIVAAAQRQETSSHYCGTKLIVGECAEAYNVLTVLPAVPPQNGSTMLRPNIMGATKDIIFMDDLVLSRLPKLSYFDAMDSNAVETARQRWAHHTEVFSLRVSNGEFFSEGGRAFRAHLVTSDYAAGVAVDWYADMAALFSGKLSSDDQAKLLASMLSYGLDLYKGVYDDNGEHIRYFGSGAGQFLGKFMPPVLLAALSNSIEYKTVLKTESNTVGTGLGPNELEQVKVGPDGRLVWGDGKAGQLSEEDIRRYWGELYGGKCYAGASGTCNPNIGKKTTRDPYGYIDGPPAKPGTSYASVVLGPQRAMVSMMFAMPEICETINNKNLVDYVLRVDRHGTWTRDDPCAPPDPREGACDPWRDGLGCKYYRVTWGPSADNIHQCITNGPGQNGRYPHFDGTPISIGYQSPQIEKNWDRIVGEKTRCDGSSDGRPRSPSNVQVTKNAS